MEKTVITQNNTQVLTAPDTYEYKIETSVSERGELPFIQIFVFTIVDPADPTLDKFARVAVPGDLDGATAVIISRDEAVLAGKTEFLSSYFSVQYPDLTIATQARSAITTRINDLIKNWLLYRDKFMVDSGDLQYFPTVDPAFEQQRIDAYASAKETRVAAEQEVLTASTELTLAQKDAATAQSIYEIYKNEQTFCQKTHLIDWAAFSGAVTTFVDSAVTNTSSFLTRSKTDFAALATLALGSTVTWPPNPIQQAALAALSSNWTDWYNAIVTMIASAEGYATVGAPAQTATAAGLLAFCTNATAKVSYTYNAKVAADSAVADAVLNKKEAEASLAAAQAAEDAALAAVMEVCPTFDPASV